MNANVINVTESNQFEYLYNDSALTIEGLTEETINDFVDWVNELSGFNSEEVDVYLIKGKEMNKYYGLTGNNAYPDDLSIVSIPLSIMSNYSSIVIPRFQIGARWFDDIVENNKYREENY